MTLLAVLVFLFAGCGKKAASSGGGTSSADTVQIKELSALVRRDINMAEYDANVFEQIKVNGGLYGLPMGVYTLVVCYNKVLFDEAGIPYPSTEM
jgi:multiple sugar transport system substrate-binding protein